MNTSALKFIVKPENRLLINPLVIVPLLDLCQADSNNNERLIDIILQDAPLCAEILQAGMPLQPRPAISRSLVDDVIGRLGRDTIRSFVVEAATRFLEAEVDDTHHIYLKDLLYFSGATAAVAGEIAVKTGYPHPEEAYFTGLMHNIGKIALFSHDPEKYIHANIPVVSSLGALTMETEVFGVDHIQVAKALISQWHLESFCVDAIHCLHQGLEQTVHAPMLIKIVQMAHVIISLSSGLKGEDYLWAQNNIGINPEDLEAIADSAGNQYDQITREQYLLLLEETREKIANRIFQIASLSATQLSIMRAAISSHFVDDLRNAFIRTLPILDAVFFRFDASRQFLGGMPGEHQTDLIHSLQVPLASNRSVVAKALYENQVLYCFEEDAPPAVIDYQLMRLCGASGICCVPLTSGKERLGVFVLALDVERASRLEDKTIAVLASNIAGALKHVLAWATEKETLKAPREKDNRLRKLAHEIKTPFATITNYLHVIQLKSSQQGHDFAEIDSIFKELNSIEQLVAYYVEGRMEPVVETVDLNALLEKTLLALNPPVMESRGITVQVNTDPDLPPVVTNPTMIQQILTNLIVNAVEALDAMQGDGIIDVTTRDRVNLSGKTFVEVVIKDNGPGIVPDVLQHLFHPVKSTKGEGHAGLGLNIVRNLVAEISGEISCHSLRGAGTEFSLLIPRKTA
ncbi:MAG: HDOD domain-containing protein [Thermodesulfobacteriota bacterium]|nr:HDOD domain-containing protein [Thermodesulfobacteriota bacterium]